ncbi:cysteinyl-tRNA synthetase [Monoraphidium neglectum]|uniref:Cysteinyl-tRNA synthetase n=1 Tax=Monoraphidium neglectum TaxID=145388 RepID=A0A0D2LMX8_9CHLO|nr:cysteinyl-tRNA synthetase [Monoraphidium neglectum]KIY91396.1 cysteinyl-tRNA synthetase [Monoraphidium neglectum]|eukprot:XP_013890416.1 cysteinyl-tRNA synthetase [Monoraphidium neglectum]
MATATAATPAAAARWTQPGGADEAAAAPPPPGTLMLYNSLADAKVPFVPAGGPGSKQVSWYGCGPTVYDSAHLGHARNYVTFDILRRVLEDYFGYNVLSVMNVTDVDDKIILRARRNYLLQRFRQAAADAGEVLASARAAVAAAAEKQAAKAKSVASEAAAAADSRARSELEGAVKNEEHKLRKVVEVQQRLEELAAGGGLSVRACDGGMGVCVV